MHIDLQIRKTRKYVGTWKHLDEWDDIGSAEEIGSQDITQENEDDYDPCDPQVRLIYLKVSSDADHRRIMQAISDSYSQHGCDHEYDCCGCRSYSADEVKHEGGPIWSVKVHSSRNY